MTAIVYVDNENMPYQKYEDILEKHLLTHTKVLYYKIFAGIREIAKLDELTRLKHRFIVCPRPITRDKNSADITLVIELMKDLLKNPAIETFIICSNDSDFIPVCKEVHENGKKCWLVIDSYNNSNELLDKIYDKVIDLDAEQKIIIQNTEKLKKQIEEDQHEKHRKQIQSKLLDLINEYRISNPHYKKDNEKINISRFEGIMLGASINWRLHDQSYKDFLVKYLPATYKAKGHFIIPV
jgi:hypothetical protein